MIFQTQPQLNCVLIFAFFGIIIGIISNCFSIIFFKKHQKNYQKTLYNIIFYGFFSVFLIFLINLFNFGKFSFALICTYILNFLWITTLTNKLVVILEKKWYTTFNSLLNKHKLKPNTKEQNEISSKS